MKKSFRHLIAIALTAVMALSISGVALADNAHFTYTNIKEDQPDLYVTKTASSALAGYSVPDSNFTFVLKWDKDGDGYLEFADSVSYFIYDEAGVQVVNPDTSDGSYRTSSTGRFTLKAGQYARFEWAGTVDYEVTELETSNFIQTVPAGSQPASGTVSEDGTIVNFENLYIPPDSGGGGGGGGNNSTQLVVRKDISWPSGTDMPDLSDVEFTFRVSIDGMSYANEAYTVYDADMTTQQGTGRTDENGYLTITGGQLALFDDIEVGVDYKVEEIGTTDVDGWRIVGSSSYVGSTTYPIIYTYFTNTTSAFSVEKERSDGITGLNTLFTFALKDSVGTSMNGVRYYLYNADGTLISDDASLVTDESGYFSLQAGQKAVFIGIAEGVGYQIKELVPIGYTVDNESYTGTVDASNEAYRFVNTEQTEITIRKAEKNNSDKLLGGAEFTLYRLEDGVDADNATDEDWKQVNVKTTGTDESADDYGMLTFSSLAAGTYKIVETKAPEDYMITTEEPIIVTLPYTMTEQEIIDQHINVDDPDFKGIYSERDGVYYFYDLTYDVTDSGALIVMPNAGGNAWIMIVVAVAGGAAALVCVFIYRRRQYRKAKVRG